MNTLLIILFALSTAACFVREEPEWPWLIPAAIALGIRYWRRQRELKRLRRGEWA